MKKATTKQISLKIDAKVVARLDAIAGSKGLSRTQIVEQILSDHFNVHRENLKILKEMKSLLIVHLATTFSTSGAGMDFKEVAVQAQNIVDNFDKIKKAAGIKS